MNKFSDIEASKAIGAAVQKMGAKKGAQKALFKKTASKKSAKAKATVNREPKAEKTPKAEPITSGPNATHARDLDTGKAVPLDAKARKAVQAFYSRQMPSTVTATPPTTPAVDLTKIDKPAVPKVPVKRSRSK